MEAPQKTFGGTYRQLCKDIKEMKDQTDPHLIKGKSPEDVAYWLHIHDLEDNIIFAVLAVEAHDSFQYMERRWETDTFRRYWSHFRKLPERWQASQDEWNDLKALIGHRDWNRQHESLESAYDHLKPAHPVGGWKDDHDWKEDYRASASPKGAIPETREITFGGAFRKLVRDLHHMVYLIDQENPDKALKTNNEGENIREQEIIIREAVKKLSSNELLNAMVAGLKPRQEMFMDYWKDLEKLSSEWEESRTNSVTHVDDRDCKKDRNTLVKIERNIHWACPWGSTGVDEWKKDYRGDLDPLHMTFGRAWRQTRCDMECLSVHLSARQMASRGRKGDSYYWKSVQEREERIRDNVPKLPHHPFFEHMIIPSRFHSRDRERSDFMSAWKKLERLTQEWRRTSEIWNHPKDFEINRNWENDGQVLKALSDNFRSGMPRGLEDNPEWDDDFLPVSRIRNDVDFVVDG